MGVALEFSIADEILDEMEVSDLIAISDLERKTIWHLDVPDQGIFSFVLTEVEYDALTLPQRAALKKAARNVSHTKLYRLEGPVKGKLMPLSVKCFRGFPLLKEVFAENMDSAEAKLFPVMAGTLEVIGAGVIIHAAPRERYETIENLTIEVSQVEEAIATAEADEDRDTVRALRRAIRLGEQRVAAITRGKEKKVEEGQVALF